MSGWVRTACFSGFLAVGMGAFGAHALRGRVPEDLLNAFETGVLYHLVHSAVLLALALHGRGSGSHIFMPACLFCAGTLLFSGSLYLLALTEMSIFGPVTPIGGLLLLGGWLTSAYALAK